MRKNRKKRLEEWDKHTPEEKFEIVFGSNDVFHESLQEWKKNGGKGKNVPDFADRTTAIGKRRSRIYQFGILVWDRWSLLPENRIFNIHLHRWWRSEEILVKGLHSHNMLFCIGITLKGSVWELVDKHPKQKIAKVGSLIVVANPDDDELENAKLVHRYFFRWYTQKVRHSVLIPKRFAGKTWTLFITGPEIRKKGESNVVLIKGFDEET